MFRINYVYRIDLLELVVSNFGESSYVSGELRFDSDIVYARIDTCTLIIECGMFFYFLNAIDE